MNRHHHRAEESREFSREISGLPASRPTPSVTLADGDHFDLEIAPVAKRIGDAVVRMLAYNGSVPGPTLRVKQNSEIVVNVTNHGDVEATVHWHGLRLENRYDGAPHETQKPIAIGETFLYRVRFPDEGLYWYHPHIREDYTQDMGLYGNLLVEPADPDVWPPVDGEVILTVDDVLIEDGRIAAFDRSGPNYTAMGRFGNVFLVNGEPAWSLHVRTGEVVRFWLTNTANTRVYNLRIPGASMKLVGGDSGRYEREVFVDEVQVAPSERAVVDVLFAEKGDLVLEHRTPGRAYVLGRITVSGEATSSAAKTFSTLRTNPELEGERERMGSELERQPDKTLALVAEMDLPASGTREFGCPMHPEVVSDEPGRCPKCGMRLMPVESPPAASEPQSAHDSHSPDGTHGERHGPASPPGEHGHAAGTIEWEDTMVEVNRETDPENMRWLLVDKDSGKRNWEIDWSFSRGDRVKIRLVNEMDSDHPMQHPFHIHGAGRFLVLSRGGVPEPNLVWKDTVLVKTGEVVDLLLDVSNPGRWMAHCHIAEHAESGMMFTFSVLDRPTDA